MHLLQTIGLLWTQYRAFRVVLAEFRRCSNRELGELGIARGDITRLAYEESERRVAPLAVSRPASEPRSWSGVKPAAP